jgi:hypothetical protein
MPNQISIATIGIKMQSAIGTWTSLGCKGSVCSQYEAVMETPVSW